MKRRDLKVGDRVMVEYITYGITESQRLYRERGTVVDFDDGGKSVVVTMDPDREGKACERRVTRGQCIPLKKSTAILGCVISVSAEGPNVSLQQSVIKTKTNKPYCDVIDLNGKHVKIIEVYPDPEPRRYRKQCSAKDALE